MLFLPPNGVKMLCLEAGDEIVDLTCESLEPVVVDLTHNDSVVVRAGPVALSPVTCVG